MELIPIVISLGFFGMIMVLASFAAQRRKAEAEARAQVQTRLLDKFGSSKEFVDFLQTDSGRSFLSNTQLHSGDARRRILTALTWGVTTAFAGLAFVVISASQFVDDEYGMMVPGIILLSIGIGILLSSFISYRLSRSWGMLSEDGRPNAV